VERDLRDVLRVMDLDAFDRIDTLLYLGDRLVPIEVKAGATVPVDALDGLRWWMKLPGNNAQAGVLVHGGDEVRQRGEVVILPWFLT
jgi:hypothetical protein